jgi:maleylacetoacetate isomerase
MREKHGREAQMKLYSFFRSSAAFRVRIALGLKGLPYETVPIHLSRGEHRGEAFRGVNPQRRVPALVLDDGTVLIQSLAIIEYLDEIHPQPPLLPDDSVTRAKVRAVAGIIGADIHPVNNSGVLRELRSRFKADEAQLDAWIAHWILEGFAAVEALIEPGPFAFGSAVTIADICIVPQVYNAQRFKVPLDDFPRIAAVDAAARLLPAFAAAFPEAQPDAE